MRDPKLMVADIYKRLDKYSLVVQKDGDEGDSAYRSAIFSFLMKMINHPQTNEYYKIMLEELTVSPGVFHRTANPGHWGFNENNFSRDQAAALMLAANVHEDKDPSTLFYKNCKRRHEMIQVPKYGKLLVFINKVMGFHQNINTGGTNITKVPDLVGNGEWANQIRFKKQWWLYPWLTILDISFLLGLYLRNGQPWDFDSLYAKDLIYANLRMPTLFSLLSRHFYAKVNYIERIRNNYADINNGIEPLGELYEYVCRKFINKENNP